MINFDFLTLKAFLQENEEFLLGARLQKIQQPTRQELIFTCRNQGCNKKFYVNISPKFFHLCLMSEENYKKRFIQIPKHPPMFCMLLRKYIENAKIRKISQPEGERILELYFEIYNEDSEKMHLCLAVELMGKHSNVVLYNYDTNVIIGCAHNVGSDKSRERELIGGLPYTYPPKRNNNVDFVGFSSLLKSDIPVNETIDNYFANLQSEEKVTEISSKLSSSINAKLKKINLGLENAEKKSQMENAELYRKKGDLIMANLFQNKDFVKSIEVLDYETNSPLKIELDETKTLKENANHFYKLYNKAKTANLKSQEMAEGFNEEKDYLEQVLYSIEMANSIQELLDIQDESESSNMQNVRHTASVSGANKRMFADNILSKKINDFTVYIGKNNKQNDYIVSKLSRDEDLWFHVHNCAGSHVLLRVEAGQKVTDEVILECAKLAKEYSTAKLSSKVGVIYTKAKNLKKPPGAKLGYVIYKGEKEIIVD